MASSPQKNLQFISPPKEAGDFLQNQVKGENMKYTIDELTAAKRQIDSTLHKLRETVKTFESKDNSERYKSQITLAKRRIKAFEIANYFIENEIKNC